MDLAHKSQLDQIKRVFLAPFLFCIILLFFFIFYTLIKSEYNEYFVYGQVRNGKLLDIYWDTTSIESPPTKEFHCKIIVDNQLFDYSIQNADQSFAITDEEKILIENLAINDLVKVKILNKKQVKILEWKNKLINERNSFWSILGVWVLIIVLIIIQATLIIKIYKIYKQ